MALWFGSKYKRENNTYRDRNNGIIYHKVVKSNGRYKGVGRLGYEPTGGHNYGSLPRSKVQAIKDLKSFHQRVPRLLKK